MRRARPELRTDELVVTREAEDGDPPGPETAATGFRMTGKPNTVIPFALTVGEGAAYITIWDEEVGAGSKSLQSKSGTVLYGLWTGGCVRATRHEACSPLPYTL